MFDQISIFFNAFSSPMWWVIYAGVVAITGYYFILNLHIGNNVKSALKAYSEDLRYIFSSQSHGLGYDLNELEKYYKFGSWYPRIMWLTLLAGAMALMLILCLKAIVFFADAKRDQAQTAGHVLMLTVTGFSTIYLLRFAESGVPYKKILISLNLKIILILGLAALMVSFLSGGFSIITILSILVSIVFSSTISIPHPYRILLKLLDQVSVTKNDFKENLLLHANLRIQHEYSAIIDRLNLCGIKHVEQMMQMEPRYFIMFFKSYERIGFLNFLDDVALLCILTKPEHYLILKANDIHNLSELSRTYENYKKQKGRAIYNPIRSILTDRDVVQALGRTHISNTIAEIGLFKQFYLSRPLTVKSETVSNLPPIVSIEPKKEVRGISPASWILKKKKKGSR